METAASILCLRTARSTDAEAIRALVAIRYADVGDRLHREKADRDLWEVPESVTGHGGHWAVLATPEDRVVGSHVALPARETPGLWTFRRLYLHPGIRGRGFGHILFDWAIDKARRGGAREVRFWSDIRFTPAHAFFAAHGFERTGEEREMQDSHRPYREYAFRRILSPA
jgi:putative acetyltransferase